MIPANSSTAINYPLQGLFLKWQEYDHKLGHQSVDTETYLTLLRALAQGIGLWSRDGLKTLCLALFIKPYHTANDKEQFSREFDDHLNTLGDPVGHDALWSQHNLAPSVPKLETKSSTSQTPPAPARVDIPERKIDSQVNETMISKGTKISHVAFRNDADLLEGMSSESSLSKLDTWEQEADQPVFRLTGKYLPVEGRAVQQAMRSLRKLIPKRQQTLTDLPATIRRVARRGYFDRVVTRRSITARIPLVLLLDRRGSMVAFHGSVDQWADAAHRQQPPIPVFYFQNCPTDYVFTDPELTDPLPICDWKREHSDAFVLILSDAGAARGLYSDERLQRTQRFLNDLRPQRVAWLNPMPRQRWLRSTAVFIARRVPMFSLDTLEFSNAFRYLKGKLFLAL